MDSFSISDLAQYSGIKAHTIRIWEKRYRALKPKRSVGNTRHYDSNQLKRLLNISGLLTSDYKVSELCTMPDTELQTIHGKILLSKEPAPADYFIAQLISAAMTYDEPRFVNIFSHCLLKYGMKDAYLLVLYPALVRIGLMWLNETLPAANEHFISSLIRQKLYTAIDSLPLPKPGSLSWILFLPENEFHETGLLLAHYLIRLSGQKVVNLGANIPDSSLRKADKEVKPDNVLMFLVRHDLSGNINKYLERLNRDLKVKKIFVAGDQRMTSQLKSFKKVIFLGSADELDQQLGIHDV